MTTKMEENQNLISGKQLVREENIFFNIKVTATVLEEGWQCRRRSGSDRKVAVNVVNLVTEKEIIKAWQLSAETRESRWWKILFNFLI